MFNQQYVFLLYFVGVFCFEPPSDPQTDQTHLAKGCQGVMKSPPGACCMGPVLAPSRKAGSPFQGAEERFNVCFSWLC